MSKLLMVALFWWATWAICSHRSSLVSNLNVCSHRSLKKGEWAKRSFFSTYKKHTKSVKKYDFSQIFWVNCSFLLIERANEWFAQRRRAICSFTLLSWATWANRSWSLFWHERPEQFVYSCWFVLNNLSKSLTVAHLIWAIRANERISNPVQNCNRSYSKILLWNVAFQLGAGPQKYWLLP